MARQKSQQSTERVLANLTNAGKGRAKGVPNKMTLKVKEMILAALDQAGGVNYLAEQAEKKPGPFMALVGKVLPMQLAGEGEGLSQVIIKRFDADDGD